MAILKGSDLLKLRKKLRIQQGELADRLKIDIHTVRDTEKDAINVDAGTFLTWTKALWEMNDERFREARNHAEELRETAGAA